MNSKDPHGSTHISENKLEKCWLGKEKGQMRTTSVINDDLNNAV
jgi:hypothetical protein